MGDGCTTTSTGSGNIYVAGDTGGALDGHTRWGDDDLFLIKYTPDGDRVWIRQIGTAAREWCGGVATDDLGGIYVTGRTAGVFNGHVSSGRTDIVLVSIAPDGATFWSDQIGTDKHETGFALATDGSRNVYVTGYTEGGLNGNTNATSEGAPRPDIFLLKWGPAR
jgi:hypothetical protein